VYIYLTHTLNHHKTYLSLGVTFCQPKPDKVYPNRRQNQPQPLYFQGGQNKIQIALKFHAAGFLEKFRVALLPGHL
jgi:hypothetical protein